MAPWSSRNVSRDKNPTLIRKPRRVASADYHIQRRDTFDKIWAADTTVGGSVPHLLDWYNWTKSPMAFVARPPNRRVWHKAFLRWVRAQGHCPDTPGISKNNLRARWHSPKKGRLRLQAINLNPPRRVTVWWDGPPRP